MSACLYNLPSFSFVGGSSETISINLYDGNNQPFPVDLDTTVTFVMSSFLDDMANPILTLTSGGRNAQVTIERGDGQLRNRISIKLKLENTITLHGRYIYQISLTDAYNNMEVLGQGGILILRNLQSDVE